MIFKTLTEERRPTREGRQAAGGGTGGALPRPLITPSIITVITVMVITVVIVVIAIIVVTVIIVVRVVVIHPVSVRRFPSFRTQTLESLSRYL